MKSFPVVFLPNRALHNHYTEEGKLATMPQETLSPETNDAALVAAFRSGDAGAFDAIYSRHGATIFRFVRALTGSASDAEDITQETFIAAVDALRTLRQVGSLQPFLLGIAVRSFHSSGRRKARRERLAPTQSTNGGAETLALPGTVCVEQIVLVRDALRQLSDADRTAFLLVVQAGLTQREAATALAVPVGVVKWRVSRATAALRRYFADEHEAATNPPRHQNQTEVIYHAR